MPTLVILAIAAAMLGTAASGLAAQGRRPSRGLQVRPVRDLRFGTVVPGVPTRVRPGQTRQAGLFLITGERHMSVRVDLILPNAMVTQSGDQFPILFGRGDASASANRGRGGGNRLFDPHQPLITTLGNNRRLYIGLGGTVVPNRVQVRGAYRATITLTVANLGN